MPERPGDHGRRRAGWVAGALMTVLLVVAVVLLVWHPPADLSLPNAPAPSDTSAPMDDDPVVARQTASLTVPESLRLPARSFEAEAGQTYLVQFRAAMEKPPGSQGSAMYFGASLACGGGPDGGTLRSVGGTQNVRTGERVVITNQFLLKVEHTGTHSCRLSVNSPNAEAAAAGVTAEVDSVWLAHRVEGEAFEASAEERLPRVVAPRERAAVFRFTLDHEGDPAVPEQLLSTVHLTACTMVNGSIEDGQAWCESGETDARGSSLELTYREDVLRSDGEVCSSRLLASHDTQIARLTHHQVLDTTLTTTDPPSSCGPTVRYVVAVENAGPAPVVVHRSNTTLIVLAEQ
ncbi:hypothetical protein ACFQS2_07660 [Brachybacterium sp. GCM10030267]|uniref:hypothetical protein n=1 Tax=Brachybacterium sp. GCM10030267 TaxID=3273381 RepID=UPI00360FE4DE